MLLQCRMMDMLVLISMVNVVVLVNGQDQGKSPVVSIQGGLVSGVKDNATEGRVFYSYYSIPYAKPPVGPLRFKVPESYPAWDGILEGTQQPTPCIQLPFLAAIQGHPHVSGQEDCLYLNVFTPKVDRDARLPVLVFIHGGGYFAGQTDLYHPYALLNHDIVLVTLQYRLGFLGFLSTEDDALPGNLGLHDQLMALHWVQDNIMAFGGDPSSVTLSGHSAGGSSAHLLMISPKSDGLIHRAIIQSGTGICPWSVHDSHKEVAVELARLVGCGERTTPSSDLVECLRGVDANTLVGTLTTFMKWEVFPMVNTPRVDGDILPATPEMLTKTSKPIPILSGFTYHDGALTTLPLYSIEALRTNLSADFTTLGPVALCLRGSNQDAADLADRIFKYYLGGVNLRHENADKVAEMFTDTFFRICQDEATLQHAAVAPGQTYAYILDYRGQYSLTMPYNLTIGKHWVTHGDEFFYLYFNQSILTSPEDIKVRDIITKLWTDFARTGNPTPDASLGLKWEPSNATHLQYLSLSPSPVMLQETGQQRQAREFWSSLDSYHNKLLRGDIIQVTSPGSKPKVDSLHEGISVQEDSGTPNKFSKNCDEL